MQQNYCNYGNGIKMKRYEKERERESYVGHVPSAVIGRSKNVINRVSRNKECAIYMYSTSSNTGEIL